MSPEQQALIPAQRLRDIFDDFARKSEARFPWLDGRWTVYNHVTGSFHGAAASRLRPDFKERVIKHARKIHDEIPRAGGYAFDDAPTGASVAMFLQLTDEMAQRRTMTGIHAPLETEIDILMQHELGHLVCPGGDFAAFTYGGAQEISCENIAQAFASVSAVQAGADDSHLEATAFTSAQRLITDGKTSHVYAPVVSRIAELHARQEITALGGPQTANLAYRLACEYGTTFRKNEALKDIFGPVQKVTGIPHNTRKDAMIALLPVMFGDHGDLTEDVYQLSRSFVMPFLDRKTHITANILSDGLARAEEPDYDLRGDFWDEMREKIIARDRDLRMQPPYAVEIADMRTLGCFDDVTEDAPRPYLRENYYGHFIQRAAEIYASLRSLQDEGMAPKSLATLPRKELAVFARSCADEPSRLKATLGGRPPAL